MPPTTRALATLIAMFLTAAPAAAQSPISRDAASRAALTRETARHAERDRRRGERKAEPVAFSAPPALAASMADDESGWPVAVAWAAIALLAVALGFAIRGIRRAAARMAIRRCP
jgi:MYXO-CTERM domain-containing protein